MAKARSGKGGGAPGASKPLVIEFGPRAAVVLERVAQGTAKTAASVADQRGKAVSAMAAAAAASRDKVQAGYAVTGYASVAERSQVARLATEAAGAAAAEVLRQQQRAARAEMYGFAQAQRKAYERAGVASQLGFAGVGQRTAQVANFAHGLEGAGLTRGAAMLSRAAPLLGAAIAAIDKTADVINTYQTNYISDQQKLRESAASLDPTGVVKWLMNLNDVFTARPQRMQEQFIQYQEREQATATYGERERFRAGYDPMLYAQREMSAGYGINARAVFGTQAVPPAMLDEARNRAVVLGDVTRGTAAGEREYQNKMRLLPIDQKLQQIEIQKKGAVTARMAAETEMVRIRNAQVKAEQERERYRRVNLGGGTGDTVQDSRNAALEQNAAARAADLARQSREQGQRYEQFRRREVEIERQENQTRAERQRAEAANTQALADAAGGRAQSLGRMAPGQRGLNAALFEAAKQMTPEQFANAPDFIKQAAEAFDPEFAAKAFERAGSTTPEFRRGQRLAPETFGPEGTTPEELRQRAIQGQRDADRAAFAAEGEAVAKIAEAMKNMGDAVVAAIQAAETQIRNDIERALRIGNSFK